MHVCFLWVFGIIKCWFCFVLREIECFTISTTGDLTYHKSHRREFEWGAGKHKIVSSMWGPVLKWIIIKFSWRSFIFLFTNQRQLDSSEFFYPELNSEQNGIPSINKNCFIPKLFNFSKHLLIYNRSLWLTWPLRNCQTRPHR